MAVVVTSTIHQEQLRRSTEPMGCVGSKQQHPQVDGVSTRKRSRTVENRESVPVIDLLALERSMKQMGAIEHNQYLTVGNAG